MTGLPRSDCEIDGLAGADRLQRERRRGLADQRRVDVLRIFAEAGEEDDDDRGDDDDADDEDGAVHAIASSSIVGALSGTTTYVRLRAGISAIKPPDAHQQHRDPDPADHRHVDDQHADLIALRCS